MASSASTRVRALNRMGGGMALVSLPVGAWWYSASRNRTAVAEEVRTRIRIPGQQTTDDLLIEKCKPGDILVFDRRCETCAAGPWAALACLASKAALCDETSHRTVSQGRFNHVGLIVPGYVRSRHDEFDPSNLLLMEATPQGIVARSLKTRIECTQSRSVLLLQLNVPGEQRNLETGDDDDEAYWDDSKLTSKQILIRRTRKHLEKELRRFRDRWTELGDEKGYKWMHSTMTIGGAAVYGVGMAEYLQGPVSPSAWLVLMGLQQAAAAQNIHVRQQWSVKVEDFLRDYRFEDTNAVRLRPGWRFMAPISLREK